MKFVEGMALMLLTFILIYIVGIMFSSFSFTFTVYNVNVLLYENRDSSLILMIPDEPPYYVR